jgi:outer membrane protein assembly factor BamB
MRKLYRNVAIVTAIFMLVLTVMLGVSYYQMQQVSPLESEVVQTLKELNETGSLSMGEDGGAGQALQQQVRELDLLSRKAYFVKEGQLKLGLFILLAMAGVLVVSLNCYYRGTKSLPDKQLDPIDEWMNKSRSRRYITWASAGAAAVVLAMVGLQHAGLTGKTPGAGAEASVAPQQTGQDTKDGDSLLAAVGTLGANTDSLLAQADTLSTDAAALLAAADSAATAETADSLPIPKITSNAFRGNNSSGISSARGIATSWNLNSKKNILWQSAIPKHGYNSPVINGLNVFITGADEQARELYCFDVYTGELKWKVVADNIPGSPSAMPKVNADTGLAASTVATNGRQVCAIFATGDVVCADMEGKRLWAKNIGLPDNHYGYASSLLMFGNELIIQYQNNTGARIMALSTANGNQIWSKAGNDKIAWSSPIIAKLGGKSALVVMGNPAIAAYNPNNGEELWRVDCMTGEVGSSPAAADGVVYGASEYSKCIAIDGATGETLWEASDYLPECSSLCATKSLVFCATSYGMVCAYDAKTGELVKEHDLTTPFYSSPVVADGKVYLFSNTGKVYIFSASNFNLVNSFETGEKTFATPAFTDGMMIVRTDKSLYCVKKE